MRFGFSSRWLVGVAALLLVCGNAHAWTPNNADLDAAVTAGDFGTYFDNLSTWLTQKLPADSSAITEDALKTRLKDPEFTNALAQRQLLTKFGVDKLDAFAKANSENKVFLSWLLKNTEAMDLFLEGATPLGAGKRAENKWPIPISALEIWNKIRAADPAAQSGTYQKLAMATALAPPGTGNRGAGMAKTPADPVDRYKHFKTANENKELFPTFNSLTVWEYQKVVSSCASDEDLTWAHNMLNTWRPDLRVNQLVVNTTSEVWRRNSPFPYTDYPSVLAGGGKCGPRSSWSVMICQAFGIPAIGVGQPAHACVAYKSVDAALEPQPGNIWKVAYGRGWQVSKLEGMGGREFLDEVGARARATEFTEMEHLHWLASAIKSPEQTAAIKSVLDTIQKTATANKAAPAAPEKTEEMDAEVAAKPQAKPGPKPTRVVEVQHMDASGMLHIEADAFAAMAEVSVYDCYTGGKQVNFQKSVQKSWVDYKIDVPSAGTYTVELKVAAPNLEQVIDVNLGDTKLATINIPNTRGLWETTKAVEISLEKGPQTLRISTPFERGVALRWMELKTKS